VNTTDALLTYGFATIPNVLSDEECAGMGKALDAMEKEKRERGETEFMSGHQVVMYCVDLERTDVFLPFLDRPEVTDVVSAVLSKPFILSSFAASRSGPLGGFKPHIDGRIPLPRESTHVSAVFCVDDYSAENGAICFWPYSHMTGAAPPPGVAPADLPGGVPCTARRGSVVFFLGSTWHEVGHNVSGRRRWGVIATYCRWWVKPTFDYLGCGADVYSKLTPRQKELYGFTSRPPVFGERRHLTLTKVDDLPTSYPGK
jgi:ectoine hydroxylase-related dioxygenase (phytanoyl-CoA dioxygenase family)